MMGLSAQIETDPENINLYREICGHLRSLKRFDEALEYVRKARQQPLGKGDTTFEKLEQSFMISSMDKRISDLKKREKELNRKLKAEIKNRENLAAQLKKLIAAQTKKSGSKTSTYKMTPQEQIVSTDFAKNKGKLPWPVAEGFISEHFGVNVHPVFKQVKLTNDGITITTAKNAAVRAVFGGVVTEIMFIPGYNNVVIIRHGSYLTVYSNLVEVFIKKGDSVRLKQSIGKLAESEKNSSVLNFQVWKDKDKLDPEQWIAPQ